MASYCSVIWGVNKPSGHRSSVFHKKGTMVPTLQRCWENEKQRRMARTQFIIAWQLLFTFILCLFLYQMLFAATLRFCQPPSRQPNAYLLEHSTEAALWPLELLCSSPLNSLPYPLDQTREKGEDVAEPPLNRRGRCFLVLPITVTLAGICFIWSRSFFIICLPLKG